MSYITLPKSFFCILTISIISSILYQATADVSSMDELLNKQARPKKMREKLTHFTFYWQDILTGKNPTAVPILYPRNNFTYFGGANMIDDALTLNPDPKSDLLGRAQGLYAGAQQSELALLMAMNFVFLTGKYNGSTLSIMGRNPAFSPMREMPVIGGSGLFRFARGYVQARTHMFNNKSGDATVKYDVYVRHYVY